MEVDGSRLLYLESCEGLVSSLKAENEQLEGKLEFTKMAYQSSLSENTKLKSIIESQTKTTSKLQSDLWCVEGDLSIAKEETTQLKDEYEQLKESHVFLHRMYDGLNAKRSAYEEENTQLKEKVELNVLRNNHKAEVIRKLQYDFEDLEAECEQLKEEAKENL